MGVGYGRFEAMFAKIVNPLWPPRTRALARCHFIFIVVPSFSFFLFHFIRLFVHVCVCVCVRVCVRVCLHHSRGREDEQSQECLRLPLSLPYRLVYPPRFQRAVSIRGCRWHLSRRLELDLSNPRAIAPRPLFSPSFHALLPLPPSFARSNVPRGTTLLLLPRFRILGFPARLGGAVAPVSLFSRRVAARVEQLDPAVGPTFVSKLIRFVSTRFLLVISRI